jgi:hypothetical protein
VRVVGDPLAVESDHPVGGELQGHHLVGVGLLGGEQRRGLELVREQPDELEHLPAEQPRVVVRRVTA